MKMRWHVWIIGNWPHLNNCHVVTLQNGPHIISLYVTFISTISFALIMENKNKNVDMQINMTIT